MKTHSLLNRIPAPWRVAAILTLAAGAAIAKPPPPAAYTTYNLDSDIPGVAAQTDPVCIDPWGVVTGIEGNLHVSQDATGVSTLYSPTGGLIDFTGTFHVISIPFVTGTSGAPTGVIDNQISLLSEPPDDFPITSGPTTADSNFIYVTEDGVLAGYNNTVDPGSAVTGTSIALTGTYVASTGFTGGCLSWTGTAEDLSNLHHSLFVADFAQGQVLQVNNQWQQVALSGTAFVDPDLPGGLPVGEAYSPFNVHTLDFYGKATPSDAKDSIRHLLLVTYAIHNTTINPLNDIPGAGTGRVAIFRTDGSFIAELPAGAGLNSPWGISVAHHKMPGFGSAPLVIFVASHGDGTIHAFGIYPEKPDKGYENLGVVLKDKDSDPLTIDGLWGLRFASVRESIKDYIADQGADLKEDTNHWYFTAGLLGETHGLVGGIATP